MMGPKRGIKTKRTMIARLIMARLSRRSRCSESWRGVGDFCGRCPGSTCTCPAASAPFTATPSSKLRGDIEESGNMTPGEASSESSSFVSICSTCFLILGDLDTWVSDAIQYIRYQVSNNHRDSKQNDRSLHDGIVAGTDG